MIYVVMARSTDYHGPIGATGLSIPPIVFRGDVLDDRVQSVPEQTKRVICGEWFQQCKSPIVVSAACGKDANASLGALRRHLEHVEASSDEVHVLLDLRNVASQAVAASYTNACQLLGESYRPRLVLVGWPFKLDAQPDCVAPADALNQLAVLRGENGLAAIGVRIDSLDSPLLDPLRADERMTFDFIMVTRSPTVMQHPPEQLRRLARLADRQVPVIAGGILQGGFLAGEDVIDGRPINSFDSTDQALIGWRKAFTSLCLGHGVRPVHACVQFALSLPSIVAVSLSTWHPDRVVANVLAATNGVPDALWASMKEDSLLPAGLPGFR